MLLHLSYRALDDDQFRDTVEQHIVDTVTGYAASTGLVRLVSLRHEFPDAYSTLVRGPQPSRPARLDLDLDHRHFPYFLTDQTLTVTKATLLISPVGSAPVDTSGLTVTVNEVATGGWTTFGSTTLRSADVAVSGPAVGPWTLAQTHGQLDPSTVGDVLLLLTYRLT